ncbi:hypothetical protein Taro_022480 [Colocasia esculenta]|uniref:K Homology domain-containing protein n=1 Tax=Colocasia esculenta TaxID=4460 RepID=A0A843V1G2_COLES|nr:hypothetical protein [Colocasia esculenta]
MERSRSKRSYYYDQDSDSQTPPPPPPRTKGRYHHSSHYSGGGGGGGGGHHRRGGDRRPPPPPPPPPPLPPSSSSSSKFHDGPPPSVAITTSFRILCPDARAGGVIGKSGSIIKTFRQETGAWISVQPLVPGDDERIIETSDNRRREPDGRPPQYSPAQEALLMIHERILDAGFELEGGEEDDEYGGGGWGGGDRDRGRVTTRLVVPRGHVGCLMGKGGKIIEQMRIETKTHIRILPRDHNTPRCVSMSEEIVQVVGESNAVKKAVAIISSRLKESLHRERGPFRGRVHSPERFVPPDDEFTVNLQHRSEESDFGQRSSSGLTRARGNSYPSRSSSHPLELDVNPATNHTQSILYEELIFRILCTNDKAESIMGDSAGILEMLHVDVGVDVHLTDPVPGSDERIIIITSEEGPNNDLFPAQEALLHIQSHIVDLGPDKDNIITTRLLVSASEVGCLEGRDGTIYDFKRLTNANVQILPREDIPPCVLGTDEVVQIVGEIRAAREALVQITGKLRSYLYRDSSSPKDLPLPPISTPAHSDSIVGPESSSPNGEVNQGNDHPSAVYQDVQTETATWKSEDTQECGNGSMEQDGHVHEDESQSGPGRSTAPPVAKKTLEVVIPGQAVPSLMMRSGNKLAQISEMSGAKVTLIEDRPELTEKVVQICGSAEQAERAQSLLQGFILSTL